ncbi:TVP38/TMEM64 family protein [Enterococcus olivae]
MAFSLIVAVYFFQLGVFRDMQSLQTVVNSAAVFGPLLFILIQIIQVIIPIIPGGLSLVAGVLLFGPIEGFVYNYIGICIGSIIIFLLSRHYGKPLVEHLVSEKIYTKYAHWLNNQQRFDKLFALAIFLPVTPDDALCLMAGLTDISFKKYTAIILLAKPASIFLYSMALVYGGTFLTNLL